ncbi:MAG: GHKL domain-containing protein [Myxococcaceae bacterium]|nr:GHKL domain-containing protein [Myxococcaceae bacterium]
MAASVAAAAVTLLGCGLLLAYASTLEPTANWGRLLFSVGGWVLLLLPVILIVAYLWAARVTKPLASLDSAMQKLKDGAYGVEVNEPGLGGLGQTFNALSHALHQRTEELNLINAQLMQAEKLGALGEITAGLAHEVRNPMVGIVGFAQLGDETTDLDEAKEFFRLIDADAQRANGILQHLLDFARPSEIETEVLDVNPMVASAVRLCAHQLQLGGIRVDTHYADGLPKIKGNSNQLRQVLLNLLLNAGQAMEEHPERRVFITTQRHEKGVEISVRDTGPGIAPEATGRIFDTFFTTKPRGKGTGLGLSVSKSIIDAHQGSIQVESEPGKGANFLVRLPAAS